MTVEILALSGLSAAEARQAADELLDLDTGPERLERLLVLDDTGLLCEHETVYARIDNAMRVERLLCVSVGPRADGGRRLTMPGNLGGNQGWPVLWMSRPAGINWKVAERRWPTGTRVPCRPHSNSIPWSSWSWWMPCSTGFRRRFSGPIRFPRRCGTGWPARPVARAGPRTRPPLSPVPSRWPSGGSASPGQAATRPSPNCSRPGRAARACPRAGRWPATWTGSPAATARPGMLSRDCAGVGGMLRRGDNGVPRYVSKAGKALIDLRDLVRQVLREANVAIPRRADRSAARLRAQRGCRVRGRDDASIALPDGAGRGGAIADVPGGRRVSPGGDSIPVLAKRLTATERAVQRRGSASYLPEAEKLPAGTAYDARRPVAQVHPAAGRGCAPRPRPRRRGAAAQALSELVLTVANREWSQAPVTSRDLAPTWPRWKACARR